MKQKLFTLLLAIVASIGTLYAQQIQIGAFYYALNSETLTASVICKSYDNVRLVYNWDYDLQIANIPSSITYKFEWDSAPITYRVTSIDSNAFRSCKNLHTVFIPASVTHIGNSAFAGCSQLRNINIPETVSTIREGCFGGCTSLMSIDIPNSIQSIETGAFEGCTNLTYIQIPQSVKNLGYCAFKGCSSLYRVDLGDGLKEFGSSAFANCTELTYIGWGNSVEQIGENMFEYCTKLPKIVIPPTVTRIGNKAFRGCTSMDSVKIGNNVSYIGGQAFEYCTNLQSITIGSSSLETIDMCAFLNCDIKEIHYTGSIAEWCTKKWNPSRITCDTQTAYGPVDVPCNLYNLYIGETLVEDLVVPNGITGISDYAFARCGSLKSITIPSNIKSIGTRAFNYCENLNAVYINDLAAWCSISFSDNPLAYAHKLYLNGDLVTDLVIPESVTSIGSIAFSGCTGLTSIKIPNSVTKIGQYAFASCENLQSVTCYAVTPPEMEAEYYGTTYHDGVFYQTPCANIILYVPAESIELYESADQWKDFYPILPIGTTSSVIRFLNWDGEVLQISVLEPGSIPVYTGAMPVKPNDKTHEYTFIGWEPEIVAAAGNMDYIAQYEANIIPDYTIRFLNWNGDVLQSSLVQKGKMPVYSGDTPTRANDERYMYTFHDWSPTITTAQSDVDYIALFTKEIIAPSVTDLADAGYDVENNVVLCFYFDDEPCNNVYLVGTPNNWAKGNGTKESFSNCAQFQPLAGFKGWYVVEFPYSTDVQAKPVQAKSDGSFSWDFQCGDLAAWTNRGLEGTQEADIRYNRYNMNEVDVYYPSPGCYIYEIAYWKNHKTPCVPKHDYSIQLYAPNACPEMKPAIIGDFNNWNEGVIMTEETDNNERTVYTYVLNSEAGLSFKFREASVQNWTNELQCFDETASSWRNISNFVLPEVSQDTTLVFDYSDNSKYRFALCEKISESDPITVRLDAQSCTQWPVVRLWAWNTNGNVFASWPGQEIELDEDGWYSYTFDESIKLVNIIWTDGLNQTININGITASTCFALNSTTGKTITVSIVNCPTEIGTDIDRITDTPSQKIDKILRDGQIFIFRGDKTYTITGQEAK